MKKIIVDKNEGIAEVIDRILNEPDPEVSLVIPKGSALGRSVSNFHLLKREADSAGRKVIIESVDETILAFAKESSLESSHPLWKGVRGTGGVSDIVSRREVATIDDEELESDEEEEEPKPQHKDIHNRRSKVAESVKSKKEVVVEEDEEVVDEDNDEDEEKVAPVQKKTSIRNRFFDSEPNFDEDDDDSSSGSSKGIFITIAIIAVIAIAAFYIVSTYFNHANITINFKQDPWSYQDNFTAEKNATSIDPTNNIIPATIFTTAKNITQTFHASSVQDVSLKAHGTITIYNNYSAASQELVATTRFETPTGQIFRLVNGVTVPGETTVSGKLTASSITAPIVADQAGPEYNIGPVTHLSIPGFQSDAGRYAGFYGVITASTTGGFTGEKASPTVADITAAEASTTAILQAAVQSGFSGNYPNNFKILPGATMTQVGKLAINSSTDDNGDFTVFATATLEAIGFDESALTSYLLSLAQAQDASSTFKTINLTYSDVTANFTTGQIMFALSAQGSLEPAFSADQFASMVAGQSISTARADIAGLPSLSNGEISIWPSWLWDIPSNVNKIHISVN